MKVGLAGFWSDDTALGLMVPFEPSFLSPPGVWGLLGVLRGRDAEEGPPEEPFDDTSVCGAMVDVAAEAGERCMVDATAQRSTMRLNMYVPTLRVRFDAQRVSGELWLQKQEGGEC